MKGKQGTRKWRLKGKADTRGKAETKLTEDMYQSGRQQQIHINVHVGILRQTLDKCHVPQAVCQYTLRLVPPVLLTFSG